MGLYKTEGIVLGYRNLGEADKILTLFSPKYGKIHAVARGVRRPRNHLIGGAQLFTYSEYLIMKGKNLDSISQCQIKESFYKIREKLDCMAYGLYFAELLRISTPPEDKNHELFKFFLKTLYYLEEWKDLEFFSRVYELKLMALQGFAPSIYSCVNCGIKVDGNVKFSFSQGGILCNKCQHIDDRSILISAKALQTIRRMMGDIYENLLLLNVSDEIKKQLKNVLHAFILYHFDRKLKTLDFIEEINRLDAHKA